MRTNGISETFCTGNEPDADKFKKWAETVPFTAGNPLYHWTHLELARYFNITELLSPSSSTRIYEEASSMLQTAEYSVRSMLKKMRAEVICTTDDPADNLEYHSKLKDFDIKILPTFRPDNVIKTEDPAKLKTYISRLSQVSGVEIKNFETLIGAIDSRHKFFHEMGGRLSDHGMERFYYDNFTASEIEKIFKKVLKGDDLSASEAEKYKTAAMLEICRLNHKTRLDSAIPCWGNQKQ